MQATVTETETPTDWNRVNWRETNRAVRNLRQRIFRASQAGDWAKVRSLQKLMLRSRANTLISVRRVTQVNRGKHTAGVDTLVVENPGSTRQAGRSPDDLPSVARTSRPPGVHPQVQWHTASPRHPDRH